MTQHGRPDPEDLPEPRRDDDQAFPWTRPLTMATGLPEWDLLPPTEFVQRPRGRL